MDNLGITEFIAISTIELPDHLLGEDRGYSAEIAAPADLRDDKIVM